jgi:hypothetical protein
LISEAILHRFRGVLHFGRGKYARRPVHSPVQYTPYSRRAPRGWCLFRPQAARPRATYFGGRPPLLLRNHSRPVGHQPGRARATTHTLYWRPIPSQCYGGLRLKATYFEGMPYSSRLLLGRKRYRISPSLNSLSLRDKVGVY